MYYRPRATVPERPSQSDRPRATVPERPSHSNCLPSSQRNHPRATVPERPSQSYRPIATVSHHSRKIIPDPRATVPERLSQSYRPRTTIPELPSPVLAHGNEVKCVVRKWEFKRRVIGKRVNNRDGHCCKFFLMVLWYTLYGSLFGNISNLYVGIIRQISANRKIYSIWVWNTYWLHLIQATYISSKMSQT